MSKNGNGNGKYPPEAKAAVLADALTGMGERRLSAKHGIPRSTIRNWVVTKGLRKVQGAALQAQTQQSEAELFDLVIDFLREALTTLTVVLARSTDPEWLGRQSARDLAVFVGVVADKAGWYLNALRRAPEGVIESSGSVAQDSEEGPATP